MEISPNLKKIKNNSKNLIHKRLNNYNIFRNKLNLKDNLNKKNLSKKGNLASTNINNTIDNLDLSNKTKVYFNFQKISMNQAKSSKRAHSAAKHNMKMNSFETSKIKNDKKCMDNLLDINNSIKKNQKKMNSHKKPNNINQKYNLLHKKNLNKININFKNKSNKLLVEENKRRMLKTELIKEKGKNIFESKKMNLTNINIDTIANINNLSNLNNANIIRIIDNTNNDTNEGKVTQKNYSLKTNGKKNNNKISPKKFEFDFKGNNKKYIMRTFDKVKHDRLWKQNLNKYSKMSGNLNMNYNLHKKTLENEDYKKHKINIDISTNIGCSKAISSSKNNKINEITKKKIERNFKKKGIGNKTDIFDNKDLNINIDLNNKKSIYRDIHISQKNSNLNTIESTLKTDPNQKNSKKSNLNTLEHDIKDDNKQVNHMKIISHNTYKAKNHKTGNNHSKKTNVISNLPKHLNKTSTISNVNSSIKNPFLISDSNNYENCNSLINYNTNYTPGTHYLNKKYTHSKTNDLIQNNNKKKPCVTIRNTVINFNMIDSGLILASLNKKKDIKKRNNTIEQNNSVNRINNNHLSGLCSKFNNSNNLSINNNLISNVNHSSINDFNIKTKTINANSNNNIYINNKKILGYAENINKNYRKIIHINNKNYINNQDKGHTKYNSMRLEDFYGLKKNKKNMKNFKINTSNLGNITDNKIINIEQKQLSSFNKGNIISERNKNYNSKNKK